jgi:hypothetical protein
MQKLPLTFLAEQRRGTARGGHFCPPLHGRFAIRYAISRIGFVLGFPIGNDPHQPALKLGFVFIRRV